MENSETGTQNKGTPQVSPLSPFLENIYLDQLDKQWKASGLSGRYVWDSHLIRYADDVVILTSSNPEIARKKLDQIMESIDFSFKIKKTRTVRAEEGFDLLGFSFVRQYSAWRKKKVTRWFPSPRAQGRIR